MIRSQFSRTRSAVRGLDVAEHVRMTPDELLVHVARDGLEVAEVALLQEQREEEDLEEQVAELVEQLRVVVGQRRVRDLVCLLDRVRHDRARGLLAIPRDTRGAAARSAAGDRVAPARGQPVVLVADVVVVADGV